MMLTERIEAWVRRESAETFETLVRDAFAHQCERSAPVRRLAESASVEPASLESWRQVPMVPTLAFKTQDLAVAEPKEEFHSSGTTDSTPSVHRHPYPELYRAVIDATFPAGCLHGLDRPPMLSLIPERDQAPHSSLAFMVDHAYRTWGGAGSRYVVSAGGIRVADARGFLAARQRDGRATLILTTAFALLQLLDGLERLGVSFRLPIGSRLFETGGTKGRSREVSREDLVGQVGSRLGVPATHIVREYGMTELTSHGYGGSNPCDDRDLFHLPPWARFRVLDPVTLNEAARGEPGLLAIFDLANLGSALHVLTEDLAIADGTGFRLAGRAAGAELRGCSLLSEALSGRAPG